MKLEYIKPTINVIEIQNEQALLTGSGDPTPANVGWSDNEADGLL